MSAPRFSIIQGDAVLDKRLSEIHLRVLLMLGRRTDKHGWCEVSQTKMAKEIDYSRQRVNIAFRDLTDWKYIQKRDQFDTRNQGRTISRYRVLMDREPQDVDVPLSPTDDSPCHLQRLQPPVTSEGDNLMTPLLTTKEKNIKKEIQAEFVERFWPQYPRKVAKPKALAAFLTARKSHSLTSILLGLSKHAAAWEASGTEPQFIPHPTTFLNQERFNDEPSPSSPAHRPAGNGTAQLAESLHASGLIGATFSFGPGESEDRSCGPGFGDGGFADQGRRTAQGN